MKKSLAFLFAFCALACGQNFANWFVVNPPNLASFTWNNQQAASYTTAGDLPVLAIPYHASPANWDSLVQAVPGSTYTLTFVFVPQGPAYGIWHFGVTLQDASNKAMNLMLNMYNGPGQLVVYEESSASVYAGYENALATFNLPVAQVRGLRIVEDGTHRTFFYSADGGTSWEQQYQVASGTYLTPTNWGVVGVNVQPGYTVSATIYQLGATTP